MSCYVFIGASGLGELCEDGVVRPLGRRQYEEPIGPLTWECAPRDPDACQPLLTDRWRSLAEVKHGGKVEHRFLPMADGRQALQYRNASSGRVRFCRCAVCAPRRIVACPICATAMDRDGHTVTCAFCGDRHLLLGPSRNCPFCSRLMSEEGNALRCHHCRRYFGPSYVIR